MHNLGLGGIEFSPTHTVDEHRTKDYKLAEISIGENESLSLEKETNFKSFTNAHAIANNEKVQEVMNTTNPEQNSNPQNDSFYNMWNSSLWQASSFIQMHDPKHRHPRHQGMKLNICLLIHSKFL